MRGPDGAAGADLEHRLRESGLVQPDRGAGNLDFKSVAGGAVLHAYQGQQSTPASRRHGGSHLVDDPVEPYAGRLFHTEFARHKVKP